MNETVKEKAPNGVYFFDADRLVIVLEGVSEGRKAERVISAVSKSIHDPLRALASSTAIPADKKLEETEKAKKIPETQPQQRPAQHVPKDLPMPDHGDRNAAVYNEIARGGDEAFTRYANTLRSGKLTPDQARELSFILGRFMAVRLAKMTKEEVLAMSSEDLRKFCNAYISRSDMADYSIYVRRNNIKGSEAGLVLYLSDKYRKKINERR